MLHVQRHAPFEDPDRTEVENRAIHLVETSADVLIAKYKALPDSMKGRYINSDLFKEIFPEYAASPAHRSVFNVPIHNSAAVLANELFHRMVAAQDPENRDRILFITGIPGAGKSTAIQKNAIDLADYKVIYEGQLSNFEQAKEKIKYCLSNKCSVDVFAFHRDPEGALRNTFSRFTTLGRGASITAMSNIQGNLGGSFEKLHKEFYQSVTFCVIDLRSNNLNPICGDSGIAILKCEGDVDAIRKRLECELERWRNAGRINEACYREAAGRSPFSLARLQEIYEQSSGGRCQAPRQSRSTDGACENLVVSDDAFAGFEEKALETKAEQQHLVDVSAVYDAQLKNFTQAKSEQADRLVVNLENKIASQSQRLQAVAMTKPNAVSALWRGSQWREQYGQEQRRQHELETRLSRVKILQADTRRLERMAEDKLRREQKELTARRDAQLLEQRKRLFKEKEKYQSATQDMAQKRPGRGRSLRREQ